MRNNHCSVILYSNTGTGAEYIGIYECIISDQKVNIIQLTLLLLVAIADQCSTLVALPDTTSWCGFSTNMPPTDFQSLSVIAEEDF